MASLPYKKMNFLNNKARRGFSLVISLVMMGMMLLVAIALVSFVWLEAQLTENKVRRYQAQANAICGLRIALGQLQLLAGDDQRITATADIFSNNGENKSLPSGTPYDGKRHWTGVWATGGLDKSGEDHLHDWDITKPDKKPFLGWLVSDYSEATANYSPIELPIAKSSADASKGDSLLRRVISAFSVPDDSVELVTLVGAGTLGKKSDWNASKKNTNWEENIVKVRRVPLEKRTEYQREGKLSGSFAYWVGDEGVKARINLEDAYANVDGNELDGLSDWERGFRTTAQRAGVEIIKPAYELFTDWWKKDITNARRAGSTTLPYVQSTNELAAYAGDDYENLIKKTKPYYHDISYHSRGVLSDAYNGGLKTDLSVAFEMPWFGGEEGWEKGFRDYPQFHGSQEYNEMALLDQFKANIPNDQKWWTDKASVQKAGGLGFLYEFQTKNQQAPDAGIGGMYRAGGNIDMEILRGPTWDLIRNYYRLYKRETERKNFRGFRPSDPNSWTAVGMIPYSYLQGKQSEQKNVNGDGVHGVFGAKASYAALTGRGYDNSYQAWNMARCFTPMFNGKEFLIPQSMRLAPVILRMALRFSIVLNQDTSAIVVDPIFVIHNPYNVPLEYFGIGAAWTKFLPFDVILRRTDGGTWGRVGGGQASTEINNIMLSDAGGGNYGQTFWILRHYAGTESFNAAPKGSVKLLPGEVKVIFPNSAQPPKTRGTVGSLGGPNYEEYSNMGYTIPLDRTTLNANGAKNLSFEIDIVQSQSSNETDMFCFHLYYPEGALGQNLRNQEALTRSYLIPLAQGGNDYIDAADENLVQVFGVTRKSILTQKKQNFTGKTFTMTAESGYAHAQKQFFAVYDVYRAGSSDSPFAGPAVTNARPWTTDPRNNRFEAGKTPDGPLKGEYDTLGAGWVATLNPVTNDFSPVEHVSGNAFWGDDFTSSNGCSSVVLFEVPTRPLTSLGQLQSADCGITDVDTSYAIGNSYPALKIKDPTKIFEWEQTEWYRRAQPFADHSYAANLALFDRYFFSGINCGNVNTKQQATIKQFALALLRGEENPMPNKRVSFIRNRMGNKTNDDITRELQNPNQVARNFLYEGMFNVNSTSVEAWKAQLASLHKQFLKIDGKFSQVEDFPLVRFAMQIGHRIGGDGNVKDTHDDEGNGWRWFRSMSDKDLEDLAEKIVEQVRKRGPFMSMADFVNRRIAENNAFAQKGALQAAIDEVSRINSSIDKAKNIPEKKDYPNLIPDRSRVASKAGAPGYLLQGDILNSIGAGMAVRSDTFTIRAYGDVFGLSGVPEAKAYCEAVVQRLPDWVVEEDKANIESEDNTIFDSLQVKKNYRKQNLKENEYLFEKFERNTRLKPANKLFGRRFKVIGFRWLSPDEI